MVAFVLIKVMILLLLFFVPRGKIYIYIRIADEIFGNSRKKITAAIVQQARLSAEFPLHLLLLSSTGSASSFCLCLQDNNLAEWCFFFSFFPLPSSSCTGNERKREFSNLEFRIAIIRNHAIILGLTLNTLEPLHSRRA